MTEDLRQLSASQAEKFDDCERAAVWEYNFGLKSAMDASAPMLGSRVHAIHEARLKDGTPPDLTEQLTLTKKKRDGTPYVVTYFPGQIAHDALYLAPTPGTAIVEGKYKMATPRARWGGARDFVTSWNGETWAGVGWGLLPGYRLVLGDFKTTADEKYALDVPGLLGDIQGNLYAYALLNEFGVDSLLGRWVYMRTDVKRRNKSWPVEVTFERSRVTDTVEGRIDTLATRIYLLRAQGQNIDPNDLPPAKDPTYCDAYGGCIHRATGRCKKSVYDYVGGGPDMSGPSRLMDFLAGRGVKVPTPVVPGSGNGAVIAEAESVSTAPWSPGDPLSEIQEHMANKGKMLWVIAMAADNPPDVEVAKAWPGANEPYQHKAAQEGYGRPALHAVPPPAASEQLEATRLPGASDLAKFAPLNSPAPLPTGGSGHGGSGTQNGIVPSQKGYSAGVINSPEAPTQAARNPEEAKVLAGIVDAPAPADLDEAPTGGIGYGESAANADKRREALKAELVQRGLVDSSCRFGAERLQKLLDEDNAKRAAALPEPLKPSTIAPPPAIAGIPAPVSAPAPAMARPASAIPPPARVPSFAAPATSFTLYVDCVPTKGTENGDVIWFSEIAERVLARFRQGHPDTPHYGVIDYGKGPGIWSTYLEGYLTEVARLSGIHSIVLDTRSREGADSLSVLERLASNVVKGLSR